MDTCPCKSGKTYAECCEPYHKGAPTPTAEACMRSRYSAFAKGEIEHLKRSLHPRKRAGFDDKSLKDWAENSEWTGLDIVDTVDGLETDTRGTVEFIAHFIMEGEPRELRERAEFKKEGDTWYYYSGKIIREEQVVRETPKVGRNEPCPCGSGKKFKKCCGK